MEDAPLLTKTVKMNQSEGIPGSGIPERTFLKNSYKRSRTSLPSPPLFFIAFFTLHRSPLSERLEQAITVCSSSPMPNCNHEEADTSIVVHVPHALQQGLTTVQVRTVDTDVVVVLIGVFHMLLLSQPKADICVAFGVGKNYRLYSISALSTSLGTKRSQARDFWMRHNLCFLGKRKEVFLASLDSV